MSRHSEAASEDGAEIEERWQGGRERETQRELNRSLRRDPNVERDPQVLALGGLKQLTNYPNR